MTPYFFALCGLSFGLLLCAQHQSNTSGHVTVMCPLISPKTNSTQKQRGGKCPASKDTIYSQDLSGDLGGRDLHCDSRHGLFPRLIGSTSYLRKA